MKPISRRSFLEAGITGLATAALPPTASAAQPRHVLWTEILAATVSEAGWVDYQKLQKDYLPKLDGYLRQLGAAPSGPRGEQIAFWVNAYNAVCVKTLLEAGLPEEVPHAKFLGKNIFTEEHYTIGGKKRSLDDIEHGILRKQFKEPRLHAALVCGASSCPRLRAEAYEGSRLSAQLDEECRSWLRSENTKRGQRKNYLDEGKKAYFASKIFDWYEDDFGGSDQGVLAFIQRFVSPSDRRFMQANPIELEHLDYDWHLNTR